MFYIFCLVLNKDFISFFILTDIANLVAKKFEGTLNQIILKQFV